MDLRMSVVPFVPRRACRCKFGQEHTLECLWGYLDHALTDIPGISGTVRNHLEAFRELVEEQMGMAPEAPRAPQWPREVRP